MQTIQDFRCAVMQECVDEFALHARKGAGAISSPIGSVVGPTRFPLSEQASPSRASNPTTDLTEHPRLRQCSLVIGVDRRLQACNFGPLSLQQSVLARHLELPRTTSCHFDLDHTGDRPAKIVTIGASLDCSPIVVAILASFFNPVQCR